MQAGVSAQDEGSVVEMRESQVVNPSVTAATTTTAVAAADDSTSDAVVVVPRRTESLDGARVFIDGRLLQQAQEPEPEPEPEPGSVPCGDGGNDPSTAAAVHRHRQGLPQHQQEPRSNHTAGLPPPLEPTGGDAAAPSARGSQQRELERGADGGQGEGEGGGLLRRLSFRGIGPQPLSHFLTFRKRRRFVKTGSGSGQHSKNQCRIA